ncbi:hypothetical protein KBZ18_14680 [Synechococcus sp. Cruz-9H2]|uniref:hypothetical protein n=1 Tax=unclassified Synechococcus TaxID=2626047 RepID=UPI0020CFAE0E|nr:MULTISPECIES: hypothetical protein [unclassified Synechococcus]MCP9820728.1 hypothetical protein [Synechococcus sp. Cruz-9H2]MCP9845016.1 hypothetical protein [Synechococcus sp. Edmonson 11F2]MCP9857137.1 hypothetical protein [Synechococcus sp. Cruz-9C9]MCP9864422.1 hypothetical protein [Synechococcus sp. Cruz-7E5]MCP9871638.1 hypothetical protein [Synechococcus sp. Cruz-7B9]
MNLLRTTPDLGALMLAAVLASALVQGLWPGPVWSQPIEPRPAAAAYRGLSLSFGGQRYWLRFSAGGQHEFTPGEQSDLTTWRDMVTLNVHENVRNDDQLAGLANGVLANYRQAGRIIRTASQPRTAARPAEHLIVALLAGTGLAEAAAARVLLVDGVGVVVVRSHRAYGAQAVVSVADWLTANGPGLETSLMTWSVKPTPAQLR